MPMIEVSGLFRDIELAVFDKDGTLVDFDRLWAGKLKGAVAAVASETSLIPEVTEKLLVTLGVDPVGGSVVPESPLAVSTLPKLGTICAVVLYQTGLAWHAAESIVSTHFMPVIDALPGPNDLLPLGDLVGLFGGLKQAGIATAIFTSDSREPTEASLPRLGLDSLIDRMVCGDDGLPSKPAPDGLLQLAQAFGVLPERIMMVGDSVADMRAGRNAEAGLVVGVLSGTGSHEDLAAYADIVVRDVHEIRPRLP